MASTAESPPKDAAAESPSEDVAARGVVGREVSWPDPVAGSATVKTALENLRKHSRYTWMDEGFIASFLKHTSGSNASPRITVGILADRERLTETVDTFRTDFEDYVDARDSLLEDAIVSVVVPSKFLVLPFVAMRLRLDCSPHTSMSTDSNLLTQKMATRFVTGLKRSLPTYKSCPTRTKSHGFISNTSKMRRGLRERDKRKNNGS